MASTIKIKNSSTAGAVPTSSDLVQGELAINVTDRRIFTENASGTVVELGTPSIDDNGNATAITIDSSENVGIGTASPAAKLEVARTDSADGIRVTVGQGSYSGNVALFGVAGQSNGYYITKDSSNNIQHIWDGTGGAERMRINSSGNLLVGTTSSTAKLTVISAANANGVAYLASSSASDLSNPALILSKYDNNSTTSQVLVRFIIDNGNSAQGQINANGAAAAAFGAWSDQRLKENIVDLPSQLDNIMALRPVEFDYIESEGGGHQIGFIAQEVQNIYPDLVGERSDGMLTLTDLNKNDARLIKAIQELAQASVEQQALITTLTERITALENK